MRITPDLAAAAAVLFERESGLKLSATEEQCIDEAELASVDPEALDQALRSFIRANLSGKDPLVASCVFALGKRCAPRPEEVSCGGPR